MKNLKQILEDEIEVYIRLPLSNSNLNLTLEKFNFSTYIERIEDKCSVMVNS